MKENLYKAEHEIRHLILLAFGGFFYQHKTFLFHFPLSLHKEQVQAILSNTAFLGGKQQMCQSHSSVQQPRIPAR